MKLVSIVSPCYNEAENLPTLYRRITDVMREFPQYEYEIIWADNASTDDSREVMRRLASDDRHLHLLVRAAHLHRHHRRVHWRHLDSVKNKPLVIEEERINFD